MRILPTGDSGISSMKAIVLTGTLDFSTPGSPSSREAYILKVDPSVPAGLVNVGELFSSPEAKEYKAPYQK